MNSKKLEVVAGAVENLCKLSAEELLSLMQEVEEDHFLEALVELYGSDLGWGLDENDINNWIDLSKANQIKFHNRTQLVVDGLDKQYPTFSLNVAYYKTDIFVNTFGKQYSTIKNNSISTNLPTFDNCHYDMAA